MCRSWIFSPRLVLPFLEDFSRASLAPSSIRTQLYVEMYGSVGLSPLSAVGTSVFSFLSVKMTTYSLVSTVNILILKFIWRCTIVLYWTCSFLEVPMLILSLSFSLAFALGGGLSTLNSEGQKLMSFFTGLKEPRITLQGCLPFLYSQWKHFPQAFWITLCQLLSLLNV